jgi:hypothetical protein
MINENIKSCINACDNCAVECTDCATECLKEQNIQMLAKCIKLDVECAAICRSASEVLSMNSVYAKDICHICADVCNKCAVECEKHAAHGMEHCRRCAEACRSCAEVCLSMVESVVA